MAITATPAEAVPSYGDSGEPRSPDLSSERQPGERLAQVEQIVEGVTDFANRKWYGSLPSWSGSPSLVRRRMGRGADWCVTGS